MTAGQSPVAASDAYRAFLEAKRPLAQTFGFEISIDEINPILLPHQKVCVQWAVRGGRRALFEAFGLGKSVQQLEVLRLVLAHIQKSEGTPDSFEADGRIYYPTMVRAPRALIIAPLGVRQEFKRDAAMLGIGIKFVRRSEEVKDAGIYITNYESVRDGRLDVDLFDAVSLDEASVLRGFGGTKTFREFMRFFEGRGPRYKFVATATPDPNEYIELLAYAAFLEIMDVGQAKTRFFKRDSEHADRLTIHPHKEREFWLWVNSWAIFLQRPSDLGFSDDGYALPEIDIRWHELPTNHADAGAEKSGQGRLLRNAAIGVVDAAREKRDSLDARIAKMMELIAEEPEEHCILWHDLEAERHAIEAVLPGVKSIYGSLNDDDEVEKRLLDFADGREKYMPAKPQMSGSGGNHQRHCSWAIFVGIGFKFNDFIQAVHRLHRFLQLKRVRLDLIYTEAEREVRANLEAKWRRHTEQCRIMTEIIRQYRLDESAMAETLTRTLGVDRVEVKGEGYTLVNNDAVNELPRIERESVDLIVTSIPFSTQYEYTPSYNDFGHTDDEDHFWRQMDFLTPELLRTLKPGRVAAIHVKDRITPGGITGLGFQTVSRFSDHTCDHFERHGFAFLGRKTIVTDVVRENNSTYRLGWTEQCRDGSRMGFGMPEYLLLFRKPQTDRTRGFADEPVVKEKRSWDAATGEWSSDGYSRARWQLDAHGFTRSNGDRLLDPSELVGLPANVVYKVWKRHSLSTVYDFENHVRAAEALEEAASLPKTFMLLPPASWHPDVWTDVARMRTLNTTQATQGREQHLCPLPFDIVDRAITQYSMPGELVLDPFGGLFTVAHEALKLRRRAYSIELGASYFRDGCFYVGAMEQKLSTPTLFDLIDAEQESEEVVDAV